MANECVYVHEFIDIVGQHRARYMHHMTAYWCPVASQRRQQRLYGVWGTLGSTGRWPEVVNLWEYPGWDALAKSFDHEVSNPAMQDPFLQEWWSQAAPLRRGGVDRILVPTPWTRTIDELVADGVKGDAYAHELVTVPTGQAGEFLERLAAVGVPCVEGAGLQLAGAFEVAMNAGTECILLWVVPDWMTWASFEAAWRRASDLEPWRAELRALDAKLQRTLLIDSPLNPMKTGRQPREDDRVPLDNFFPPVT